MLADMLHASPLRLMSETLLSYAEIRATVTRRGLDRALATGALVRIRKGAYVRGDCPPALVAAATSGGRLDCISLLHALGVFVMTHGELHIQLDPHATRAAPRAEGVVRHWRSTVGGRFALAVDLVEALAQACRCQPPRAAIATLDSAWHLGLIDEAAVSEVFARLPPRFGALRAHLDPRSESGPETLVRLLLRGLGLSVDLQVDVPGVGRVDMVVDGWLIVECDSRAHHDGWEAHRRDRRRDLTAAALGYTTIRPIAEDIMYHPEQVVAAIRGLIDARTAAHNVGRRTVGRRIGR